MNLVFFADSRRNYTDTPSIIIHHATSEIMSQYPASNNTKYICDALPTKTPRTYITQSLVVRPLDVSRKTLRFTAVIFLPDSYTSTVRSGRPPNVYHRFGRRVYSILPLSILPIPPLISILPIPPLIFTGGGKMWNLASIFDTTLLAALILKRSNAELPKYHVWCSDDGTLFSPNLVQFAPPLWWVEF